MSQVSVSRSASFFEGHVSHPGAVRDHNEDAFVARGSEGFWTVADGMGGLSDGQFASRTVVEALAAAPMSGELQRDAATVAEVIREAGYVIFRESTERKNHIGSTAVALLVGGGRFAAIWAGDSRLYLWRDGALNQVTRDHTQVQQLVDAGYLTPQEAAEHPMSHVLARAVGVQAEVEIDTVVGEARIGDIFLLCSDGLPRVVEDAEIADQLQHGGNPGAVVERLIAMALERQAPDNVTILAIGCGDPTIAGMAPATRQAPILGGAGHASAGTDLHDVPTHEAKTLIQPKGSTYAATPLPMPPAPAPTHAAPQRRRSGGGSGALLVGLVLFLIVGLGVGAWLVIPRLRHAAAPQKLTIAAAVAQVDRRPFEQALGTVDCSWLQLEKIAGVPTAVQLAITGVAASPPAVQGALQAAATSANVKVSDIDLQSIAPTPAALCPALNAMRAYRAPTSVSGQNLTAAQDSFAVMKQADGKLAGRAIVDATLPPTGDFAFVQLGADGAMSVFAADRASFTALAATGTTVSKLTDTGGYRLQVDYAQKGWSSLILLTGKGPFPKALLTQPAGARNAAWASQYASAAQAGGWRAEMSWYEVVDGAQLSVIPQTQLTNTAANMIMPTIKPTLPKKPGATNAASNAVIFDSDSPPPTNTVTTTPAAKGSSKSSSASNAAASNTPPM